MKTREQVVQIPQLVSMRRDVKAAYSKLVELKKRQWGQSGTPGASYETIGQTSQGIDEATAAHRDLANGYEARVAAEMAGVQVSAVIERLHQRAIVGGWGEWDEVLAWAGIVMCPYTWQTPEAETLHRALATAGVRIDDAMPEPVRFRAPP